LNILFINGKTPTLYEERAIINLTAMLESKHDIEVINDSKKLLTLLKDKSPDIIFMNIGGVKHNEIIRLFKDRNVVSVAYKQSAVDVCINDEVESVFPLLVKAIEQGKDFSEVPGITFKRTTKKAAKWDINSIKPTLKNNGFLTFSSRGCKGKCSFCHLQEKQGPLRFRDTASVIAEIKTFSKEGFNHHYQFADPSFDSNPPKRMKTLLKAIINEAPFQTYGANFRPDFHKMADKELINLLYDSGNCGAFIGVEAANEEDIKLYNKQSTIEDADKTIAIFEMNDTAVNIGFINLNPFSTFEGLRQNLEFLKRHHKATFRYLTRKLFIKEAPILKNIEEAGLLLPESTYKYQDEKVSRLVGVLGIIEEELHQNALALYNTMSMDGVKRIKAFARLCGKEDKFMRTQSYEQRITNLLNNESDRMAEWFGLLLDHIEKETPPKELISIIYPYFNKEHIRKIISDFARIDREMRSEILKTL